MALLLQLKDGTELRLTVDPTAWTRAFERAMRNNEIVEVTDPSGSVLSINPNQVLYWTTETEASTRVEAHAAVPVGA
jgi:hypothetical protein